MVNLQVVILSILSLSLASYIPKKSVTKPGICPEVSRRIGDICISDCTNDDECPGDKKCCGLYDCVSATSCLMPILSDVGSVRSGVVLDDKNTVFGAQSSLNGIGRSRFDVRTNNVESSRRFTQTGGRTSTALQGKTNPGFDAQGRRSGLDDGGFTQNFGGSFNDRKILGQSSRGTSLISKSSSSSSAAKHISELDRIRSGQISNKIQSFDRGMGEAERSLIGNRHDRRGPVIKSSGGGAVGTFDLQRISGISGSRGNLGEFGTRRSSFQGSSSILDNISGRSDGLTRLVSETGISGLTQSGSTKICRKQCKDNRDCRLGKICVTVNNCHRYCRRGQVKNNYKS